MDYLIAWIKEIILVVLFANFVELLLPEGDMGRYVRVIVGFIIITVMLAPLLNLQGREIFQIDLSTADQPSWTEIANEGERLKADQQEVEESYQLRLKEQIRAIINLNTELEIAEIEIVSKKKYQIDKVRVNLVAEKEVDQTKYQTEIKELLIAFFALDSNTIEVKFN